MAPPAQDPYHLPGPNYHRLLGCTCVECRKSIPPTQKAVRARATVAQLFWKGRIVATASEKNIVNKHKCHVFMFCAAFPASDMEDQARGLVADCLNRTYTWKSCRALDQNACRREEAVRYGSLKWVVHDTLRDYKDIIRMLRRSFCFLGGCLGQEMFPQTRETLAKTRLQGRDLCPEQVDTEYSGKRSQSSAIYPPDLFLYTSHESRQEKG